MLLVALTSAFGTSANAQVAVVGGDFDICDYCGTLRGNTAFIKGRAGFGTDQGIFVLINGASAQQDVDFDGFTAGVDFTTLVVSDTTDFINVEDPDRIILRTNFVVATFLNPVFNGLQNTVGFFVNIPNTTPAGRYRGRFTITDPNKGPGLNANGEALRTDAVLVEIEVLPASAIGLVEANSATDLDSLVLSGRPGQTVSGVARVANLGNVDLTNVRVDATDLIATSGTGLRIRADRISFTPAQLTRIALGDTSRLTVTVRIPLGILAGRYRGELIVQAEGVAETRVPLTVVVTTPGDIVFENNPVFGRNGDNAVIIFNADAGTRWSMRIFDMQAITSFSATGIVFPGSSAPGGGAPVNGDEAVRTTWTLQNGRGENVAAGMYLVVIEATQAGDTRQLRGKLMVIR